MCFPCILSPATASLPWCSFASETLRGFPFTTPASKACPVSASAAAPAGTLRATTPMRAAMPLKVTNVRAERAEERARANALRVQIDELKAALAVANVEANRALAEERQRADRLNEQVEALSAEVMRAEKQAAPAR